MRIYGRQHYFDNKEKRLKQCRQWQKDNPEKVGKACRKWYEKNLEQQRKYGRKYYKKRKKKIRKYIDDYKLLRGCAICGYKRCPAALDFHHEGDDKEFDIGTGMHCSLENLKKEIKKCRVLCRNCHSELHYKERKNEKV